ncbi:hypothetical protein BCM43_28145 (plasmid) [Bacillus thuringiensis]|uniref:hypothetical protein n=1 Tax=Bacillus thuringiensis TaxID=1428 RepID=UPI00080F5F88|nr:hypothetical protein [Bacillus thuringiensis]ANV74327.1 hypothetical protein BCM43_28145 [Bacillus thuringiensis]
MDFVNGSFSISLNFFMVVTILVIYVLISTIVRWLFYLFLPSQYIKWTDKGIQMIFKHTLKQDDVNNRKNDGKNRTKQIIEFVLCSIATVILYIQNFFRLISKPIILTVFFVFVFLFVTFEVTNTINIYDYINIAGINDKFTLDIVYLFIDIIRIIAPLSLPFYYFAYREQKTISDSSLNGKTINVFFVLFLLFSVTSLSYSMVITEVFSSKAPSILEEGLALTHKYREDLALISLYAVGSFYFLGRSIHELLNSIMLNKLINKKINKVYLNYLLMSFGNFGKFKRKQYEYLSYQLETVYQTLIQAADKNLGNVYSDSFEEWCKVMDYMLSEYRLASFDTTTKHLHLLNEHGEQHIKLYRTLLRNHKSLIMNLIKQHKIEDAKNAINKFLEHVPSPSKNNQCADFNYDKCISKYYVTLYEIIIYLYDDKNIGIHTVLDKLNSERETKEAIEKEGIIRNLQSLIIKTIQNDDVKMLSALSYYMNNFFNDNRSKADTGEQEVLFEMEIDEQVLLVSEVENPTFSETTGEDEAAASKETEKDYDFLSASVFILLQALLKSIELTHYKSTGFLIKFLITSYNSRNFNTVFNEFYVSPYENKYLPKKALYKDIDDDFYMNSNVKDYLLIKLFILVYSQQKYVIKNDVDFWEIPEELLDISRISNTNYLKYMFRKLEKAKKEYGLMYLQDEKFMENLKKEFKVANTEESKVLKLLECVIKKVKDTNS